MTGAALPIGPDASAALPGLEFAAGTNPYGALALADWRFLLPSLPRHAVLLLGAPAVEVVGALARTARCVVVASDDERALRRLREAPEARALANVHLLRTASPLAVPIADGAFELVAIDDARTASRVAADAAAAPALARLVGAGGSIYVSLTRRGDAWRARRLARRFAREGLDAQRSYWLLRRRAGGFQLACAWEDRRAVRYAFDHVLYGISPRARLLRALGRLAAGAGVYRSLLPARALLFQRAGAAVTRPAAPAGGPAVYVAAMARRAGVDLADGRPAFFARGGYDSNKVAFFVFRGAEARPALLVKMTRSPRYNHRLEAEHRALVWLRDHHLVEAGTYPAARFLGRHHDLAVLGQDVVHGAPFRTRARASAGCALAARAIAWFGDLGAHSARPPAEPRQLVQTLAHLTERFVRQYDLPAAERDFLRERVGTLASRAGDVPRVFQHGDAGTWNALVTDDDRVAFLDWEVARPDGVPLWDLLDFLQSFGRWVAYVGGERDWVRAYATQFVAPSPFSELQADAVRRYCARVGVPPACIEPLFLACWMQRPVRESAWSSAPFTDGLYVNLVRLCIRRRGAAGLRRLLDP